MATKQQYKDAAKVAPKDRTTAEQALVTRGSGIQSVRNTDHAAKKTQRRGH